MTFIIAELGINHNGSLELAKKLVDAAKWAGADAVKLQKRDVATVYAGQLHLPRESPWGQTLGAQKYRLEFNRHQYDEFALYCEQQKMPWFASAWDLISLSFLRQYSCPYNKIASAMMTNTLFVMEVASEHKQTFASAAMCGDDDVESTVQLFLNFSHRRLLTLMHCVATYPAPEADLNLRVIGTLKEKYGLPVGYSGHEASVSPSVMAVVLGAVAVERHLTVDRTMYGSDQAASLEPHGFREMVTQIRKVDTVLGDGIRRITEGEQEVAKKLRYWLR